ncbi:MAG: sulfotransferase [Pseudomonadota bacterium]
MSAARAALADRVFCLGVGAQKAGTTWLHRYLDAHPQCWMSPIKEMHFFDELYLPKLCRPLAQRHYTRLSDMVARLVSGHAGPRGRLAILHDLLDRAAMQGDAEAYLRYFAQRVGPARVFGEITPSYSMLSARHFREIAALYGDIRPIFLMRDPVERFWSALRMREREVPGFSAIAHVGPELENVQNQRRGRYDQTLKSLKRGFAPDHVLALFYEDLFTPASVHAICAHLGLDYVEADFDRHENVSPKSEPLDEATEARIFAQFRDVYTYLLDAGYPLPKIWRDRIARFDTARPSAAKGEE